MTGLYGDLKCLQCGDPVLITRIGNRGRQAKYCSTRCRYAYGAEQARLRHLELNPDYQRNCEHCDKPFTTRLSAQRYCSNDCRLALAPSKASLRWRANNPEPGPVDYDCSMCGIKVTKSKKLSGVAIKHGVYCDDCRVIAQQARYRKKTVRRQSSAKPSGVWVEKILEAYGYICYLCNEPIDMKLPRTSKRGATVDHVIPLSKGGSDELENLRLTHWTCNRAKSNKLVEELNG